MIVTKFTFSKKRSVSTIVGGLIFLVIITSAFAAFMVMMQSNTDFLKTQIDVSELELKKNQEQFTIGAAYDSAASNRLCVSIKNTGAAPLEMMDLWIVNKSAADSYDTNLVDIDLSDAFIPVGSTGQILENQVVTMESGTYDIKAVTSSGVTKTTELRVFSGNPDPRINATVNIIPSSQASGQNITLAMHVYNRANTTLLDVQPNTLPIVSPTTAAPTGFKNLTAMKINRLDPDESTLFLQDADITGGVGSKVNFTLSAKARVEGCTSSSFITSNTQMAQLKIVPGVRKEIFAKPEILVSFPNPLGYGGANNEGKIAIVVQNPTNVPLSVTGVSMQILAANEAEILSAASETAVKPTSGWVGAKNLVYWENLVTPIVVSPLNATDFIVDIEPRNTSPISPINTLMFNVYSSYGQFGRGPLTAGTDTSTTAIGEVFMSGNTAATRRYVIPDVDSGSTVTYNATILNAGGGDIDNNSFLLINIPAGFTNIDNVTVGANLAVKQFIEFADGSTQIPVQLINSDLAGPGNSRTYSFSARAPDLSVKSLYTFTLVANGTAEVGAGTITLGPVSETSVQVCPASGC